MINKQSFALNLGLFVMAFHIVFAGLSWFVLEFPKEAAAKEITTPVTTGYAVTILKFYLDTGGVVTGTKMIGMRLVVLISSLTTVFFAAMVAIPIIYFQSLTFSVENLNSSFVFIESAFGALMALIFSNLYETQTPAPDNGNGGK